MGSCQSKKQNATTTTGLIKPAVTGIKQLKKPSGNTKETTTANALQSPSNKIALKSLSQEKDKTSKGKTVDEGEKDEKLKQHDQKEKKKNSRTSDHSQQKVQGKLSVHDKEPSNHQSNRGSQAVRQSKATPNATQDVGESSLTSFQIDKNSWNDNADKYAQKFLKACYEGEENTVKDLIQNHQIIDVSFMKGLQEKLKISIEGKEKNYDISIWNPLLIAIGNKHINIVQEIFVNVPSFHKINCIAKPYTLEEQKKKIYHHNKRLKRECFSIKLSILNRDLNMLKFLWNENRLLWNLGHVFQCFRLLIKYNWEAGLRVFLGSTTTKVIFMSVNNFIDFVDTIDLLKIEIEQYDEINKELSDKFKEFFYQRPFLIFNLFLIVASYEDSQTIDMARIKECLEVIQQDDIQLKHSDITEIFSIIGENEINMDIKRLYFEKFQNKDEEIKETQLHLQELFEDKNMEDNEEFLDLLDDLDLFAFSELQINGEKSNALLEGLNRGFSSIINYAFTEGFVNVRATLKKSNIYEIENDVSQFIITYFMNHQGRPSLFTKIYNYLIDILQLSNFLELFDYANEEDNLDVFIFILNDTKFKSLFESSLECQKYIFMKEIIQMTKESEEVTKLFQGMAPYDKYYDDIVTKKNDGEIYSKMTLIYLQQLTQEKLQYQRMSDESRHSFLKQKEEKLLQYSQSNRSLQTVPKNDNKTLTMEQPKNIDVAATQNQHSRTFIQQNQKQQLSNIQAAKPVFSQSSLSYSLEKPQEESKVINSNGAGKFIGHTTPASSSKDQRQALQMTSTFPILAHEDTFAAKIDDTQSFVKKASFTNRNGGINNPIEEATGEKIKSKKNAKTEEIPSEDEFKDIIEEDEGLVINQSRQPQILSRAKTDVFSANEQSDIRNESIKLREAYETLAFEIIECIKINNANKLRFLLRKYDIKNIQSIKNVDSESLKIIGKDYDLTPGQDNQALSKRADATYDTFLWNPVLFSIYYQRTEILRILIEDFTVNFILSLRLPPVNEFTEYIIPVQKQTPGPWSSRGGKITESGSGGMNAVDSNGGETFYGFGATTKQPPFVNQFIYNPSDASVECFGLELAIRNKDIQTMKYLWDDQIHKWEDRHFAFVFDKILQEHWDVGLGIIFRSKTSHIIFKSLSQEDKDNFLVSKIIDKITDTEFWENAQSPIKITRQQEQIVITELSYDPYGSYAVLKFPQLFQNYDLLEMNIKKVKYDDIYDFVMARKENIIHFQIYANEYDKQNAFYNKPKVAQQLQSILKKAQQISSSGRKEPKSIEKIVQLIKLGDCEGLKRYFETDDNYQLLETLNQLSGYEDKNYQKMFHDNIKYIPSDDIMRLLIADNSTVDWNPLIFAIFYQKKDIVEFLVDNSLVYVRSCLTKPFQIEMEDDADNEDEEKFVQEKTEIFCIVMCIMLHNKEILRYLWKKNSFMWNEIHFVLLTNYILESQWIDGMKALLALSNTRQIFNSMNLYEKEKFLKFCDRSVSKVNTIFLKDFRYQMSFDPYNIYYLPILASTDELLTWDKELSKELFLKQCERNFDERSFALLYKFNNHYLNEFISTAMTADSETLVNFAKKLKRYAGNAQKA